MTFQQNPSEIAASRRYRQKPRIVDLSQFVGEQCGWEKFCNTFLQAPWLFSLVIRDKDFDDLLARRQPWGRFWVLRVALEKSLWFWPRILEADRWIQGGEGLRPTPHNYLTLDPSSELLLDAVMAYAAGTEAAILDLGCNCGRHLNALYQAGYRDLTGVDAMAGALDVFRREFTDAAACSKLSHDLFQRFLSRQQDRSYDIVYSHGATLELVHPSFDIVRHICRITRRHVVLFLNEHAHAYPRFWIYEFRRRGFYLVDALRPAGQLSSMDLAASLLVFQRIER